MSDFGLARLIALQGRITTDTYGTVTHMPPELLAGGDLSPAVVRMLSSPAMPPSCSDDGRALCMLCVPQSCGCCRPRSMHVCLEPAVARPPVYLAAYDGTGFRWSELLSCFSSMS